MFYIISHLNLSYFIVLCFLFYLLHYLFGGLKALLDLFLLGHFYFFGKLILQTGPRNKSKSQYIGQLAIHERHNYSPDKWLLHARPTTKPPLPSWCRHARPKVFTFLSSSYWPNRLFLLPCTSCMVSSSPATHQQT